MIRRAVKIGGVDIGGIHVDGIESGKVRCRCGGNAGQGTYQVVGANLILTSDFGVTKISAGLGPPRRLAKQLLKNLCARAAMKAAAAQAPVLPASSRPTSR